MLALPIRVVTIHECITYDQLGASTATDPVHASPTHTNITTAMKAASEGALIMGSEAVPKITRI